THNTASQALLDIIAVSYQNTSPQEQVLQGGPPMMNEMTYSNSIGGNKLVEELKSEATMVRLVTYMLDRSAPNTSTTLTNGINIIIELIRRYCSEIEQAEMQLHHSQGQRTIPPSPSPEKLMSLATDLNDLLRVLGDKLLLFAELLDSPRHPGQVNTTIGLQTPLGSERLKTCELFAEILHLQYLYTSSPLFEKLALVAQEWGAAVPPEATPTAAPKEPEEKKEEGATAEHAIVVDAPPPAPAPVVRPVPSTSVANELVSITDKFISAKILPVCLDLFFNFPWNNFLHSVVYDMIAKVFNTYSFTSTATQPRSPTAGAEGDDGIPKQVLPKSVEAQMITVKLSVRKLVLSIFVEGLLTDRITAAQRQNDFEIEQPKGVRLGFMGHLTYISDEVCKLIEKCGIEFGDDIKELMTSDTWLDYVSGILRETKERDRQALGGARPASGQQQQQHQLPLVTGIGGFSGGLEDSDVGSAALRKSVGEASAPGRAVDDDDAPGGEVFVSDGDVASDQVRSTPDSWREEASWD
ncbi:SIT4 phosphatase-associated protein-domain-containing protein, partial [Blyttiomyces helicus]